jgi:predicted transcriptional regulator
VAIRSGQTKVALLAIRPEFALQILGGYKKVEFRKRSFAARVSHVAIYAGRPVKAVVGYFDVTRVVEDSPRNLWKRYGRIGGIGKDEFDMYFQSCERGVAIGVGKVQTLRKALPLEAFARSMRPPQSFLYLSRQEFRRIRENS